MFQDVMSIVMYIPGGSQLAEELITNTAIGRLIEVLLVVLKRAQDGFMLKQSRASLWSRQMSSIGL